MAPPDQKARRRRLLLQMVRAGVLASIVSVFLYITPAPYMLEAPGRADPVAPYVSLPEARTYPAYGKFLLTTILYERANLLWCIYASLVPGAQLVPVDHDDPSRLERMDSGGDFEMTRSHHNAKVAALRYLGYKLAMDPVGVRVLAVMPASPARSQIRPGDLVLEAGGQATLRVEDLQQAVRAVPPGGSIELTLDRDGRRSSIQVTPARMGKVQALGVKVQTQLKAAPLPVKIEIDSGEILGSSAGLMFSLEIVDRLTPEDLTAGRMVAGTGTIQSDGKVVGVVGARFKAVAAQRGGASVFLCPREDYQEALNAGTGLTVIPVGSLSEAVQKLH